MANKMKIWPTQDHKALLGLRKDLYTALLSCDKKTLKELITIKMFLHITVIVKNFSIILWYIIIMYMYMNDCNFDFSLNMLHDPEALT